MSYNLTKLPADTVHSYFFKLVLQIANAAEVILSAFQFGCLLRKLLSTWATHLSIFLPSCTELLFIISDVLKNQYSEHLKIKDLIKDKKNNNYSKEDKEYLLKDKINYYCNDRINEILNKIIKNQNKNNDNNDKYKLFEKYIKLSIFLFIETINDDKDNLKRMINYAYKLLMFYLTEIKNDYDESATECHILELMTVINDIIYCYIEVTEHNIIYNNCIAPFLM